MELTGKQKRHLRAIGSTLNPVIQIGKTGVFDSLIHSANEALEAHELIKVRVLQNSPSEPRDAITELAEATQSDLVQVIGRNGLLYKQNIDKPKVELP